MDMTAQQQFSNSLRALADFYDAHPEVKLPYEARSVWNIFHADREQVSLGARAFGSCEKVYDGDKFMLGKKFGDIKLEFFVNREVVCEKVVKGTKIIPGRIIPATEATVVPQQEVEDVEWRCSSSLLEVTR